MVKIQDIPFRSIPNHSSLFLSYLDFAPDALRFYRQAPTLENLVLSAEDLQGSYQFPRAEIVPVLRNQNNSFGSDSETMRNIENLEKANSVAILTGQQVGLFTGPVYTIYKALAAIQLAKELKGRGINAVPIFWMETEDHDLMEATRRTLLSGDYSLRSVDYGEMMFKNRRMDGGSVGSIQFPESIRQVVQDFLDHLPDTYWKPEIRTQLESAYKPGSTFAQSFGKLLSCILQGSGLILFDPQHPNAKQLAGTVFQKALRDADIIRDALVKRCKELESKGFHTQVSVLENSTLLFYFQDGARCALGKTGSTFVLKNRDQNFSADLMMQCIQASPQKFSPNVLLRPLIQDHLFPTLAYVAGPAEVAYFAQAEVLYKLWDRPMPIIWPRSSLTLVAPEIGAALDQLGIEVRDCFRGRQFLAEKVLRASGLSEASASLEELEKNVDLEVTEIRPKIKSLDATRERMLENARRKILHNVQRLRSQVARLEMTQNSTMSNTLDMLMNHCYPNQKLQERELGIQHFWIHQGSSVLDALRSSLDIRCFAHRIVRIPKVAAVDRLG